MQQTVEEGLTPTVYEGEKGDAMIAEERETREESIHIGTYHEAITRNTDMTEEHKW